MSTHHPKKDLALVDYSFTQKQQIHILEKRGKKNYLHNKNCVATKLSAKSPSLSPPIPSLSGIHKVRKSY